MSAMNRRLFIKSSAAVAASGFLQPLWAEKTHYDVIIVGAGLAGLHTAYLLEQQGLDVLLLEGSYRVGGRVHTLDHVQGNPEAGASQVGIDYDVLRGIIQRLNLPLGSGPTMAEGMTLAINQQLLDAQNWTKHPANKLPPEERDYQPNWLLWHYLNQGETIADPSQWLAPQYRHLDIPLATFLKSLGASEEALRLINSNFMANDIYQVSALQMLRKNAIVKGAKGAETITGGSQRLPEAMAANLKNPPLFNKAVTQLKQRNNLIEINCHDGSSYSAKRCVLATPFSTVKAMDLQLRLSDAKRRAINHMDYSHATHVFLKPTSEFWLEDKFSPNMWTDTGIGMVFSQQDKDKKVILLRAWLAGNNAKAVDHLSKAELGQQVLKTFGTVRPVAKGKLEVIETVNWHQNPFSRGAYAQYKAGDINRFAESVPRQEGLLHFAGEHTEASKSGMEAAVLSAERCAQELLQSA